MISSKRLKRLYTLFESKVRLDEDLKQHDFNYDALNTEFNEYEGQEDEDIVDNVINDIKVDSGLIVPEVEVEEVDTVDSNEVLEKMFEYMLEESEFQDVELCLDTIMEEIDRVIASNPLESKEAIAWNIKEYIKDEISPKHYI